MGDKPPLAHPELRDIDRLLDLMHVTEAQVRLAQIGESAEMADAVAYLSTRVLYLKGRLDARAAADRLRELLIRTPAFPEARSLLSRLESPISRPPQGAGTVPAGPATLGTAEGAPGTIPEQMPSDRRSGHGMPLPDIPRAPGVPDFQDNFAPPSYVPEDRTAAKDPLPSKSLLPRDAGRYSENPATTEVAYRGRISRAPAGSAAPPAREERPTVGHTPAKRAQAPAPEVDTRASSRAASASPNLFELAAWIDQGRHEEVLAALDGSGGATPAYGLLRARALAAGGRGPEALRVLADLELSGPLEPELGSSCARLYLELGEPGRALGLAEQSMRKDSERPLVRLTYVQSAVRAARQELNPSLLDLASRVLHRMEGREGPLPSLYQALRACVLAGTGDAEGAIAAAQRALGLDPRSVDAIAAIAEASARLGRVDEARQAYSRLAEVSPPDAAILSRFLSRLGVPTGPPPPTRPPSIRPLLWSDAENALAAGRQREAIAFVEKSAGDTARRMARTASQSGLSAVATVASTFFTTAPVFGSFAPYDSSLWSIRRLSAALDVLYGSAPRPGVPTDDAGLVLFAGAYIGETLRICHDGRWEGKLDELDAACILFPDHRRYHPFRIITARLYQGRRASIVNALAGALETPGTPAWTPRIPSAVSPPTPWAPDPWPPPSHLGDIARSLARSPIGRFCQDQGDAVLDGSATSFIALDSYLDLVAPRGMVAPPDSGWARRIAVLSGAYVGETLRSLSGGSWVFGVDSASDANAFRLRLSGAVEATPVAHVLERVSGARSSGMVDYAKALMRRSERA